MPPPTTQSVATAHAARIGQILDDFVARRRRGEPVDEAAFLAAHSDLAEHLRPHLALLRTLRSARAPEHDLAAAGVLPCDGQFGQLGPYRIEGVLGRGGMGLVLRAYDEQLRRLVALKVLRPDLVGDPAALARFERESRAAAALRHPNIVTVYTVGHDRGLPYIAMEYIDGPSLADVIRHGTWPIAALVAGARNSLTGPGAAATGPRSASPSEPGVAATGHADAPTCLRASVPACLPTPLVRHIFHELLLALDAAHQAGLIHRDIKPANILLGSFQQSAVSNQPEQAGDAPAPSARSSLRGFVASSLPSVHLADFGLARMRSSQTQVTLDGSVLGTPDYMSPEQARGDTDIDHRTDLYSAGVVLYEMLTGQTPFHADTPTATIHRILHDEPRDPRRVDKSADPLLVSVSLKMMAKRPRDRFASAMASLASLEGTACVHPHRQECRHVRRLGVATMLIAALSGVAWWTSSEIANRLQIRKVEISGDAREVIAYYGRSAEGTCLWRYPGNDVRPINCAVVGIDDDGNQFVAIGLEHPLLDHHAALVVLNSDGKERWQTSLTPSPNPVWPDCAESPQPWRCTILISTAVDHYAGQKIVAVGAVASVGRDTYPTRVSIFNARNGEHTATFWHTGTIDEVEVVERFFDEARPALLARGVNNKLDGFDDIERREYTDNSRGEDPSYTDWDMVSVLMILDPRPEKLRGHGPPRTLRLRELAGADTPAQPYAYAFLDVATDRRRGKRQVGLNERAETAPSDVGYLRANDMDIIRGAGQQVTGFSVNVGRETGYQGCTLRLDRNLKIRSPDNSVAETPSEEWCRARWHVIIREYRYVE